MSPDWEDCLIPASNKQQLMINSIEGNMTMLSNISSEEESKINKMTHGTDNDLNESYIHVKKSVAFFPLMTHVRHLFDRF